MSEKDKEEFYNKTRGRIQFYLTENPDLLDFQNGCSLLDAGCGMGENMKVFLEKFSSSKYQGFDIDKRAVSVAKKGVQQNLLANVQQGNLTDLNYLTKYLDNSFDHVLISHVFSFICEDNLENTAKLRQKIIDEFIRISRKSVIILDKVITDQDIPLFFVEHNSRSFLYESFHLYFEKHKNKGEYFIIPQTTKSSALIFKFKEDFM